VVSSAGLVSPRKLPPLTTVWQATLEVAGNGQLGDGLAVSLRRMFIGFVIGRADRRGTRGVRWLAALG